MQPCYPLFFIHFTSHFIYFTKFLLHLFSLLDILLLQSTLRAYSEPCSLTKGIVYELTALMLERTKNDHLRVGVTFPNGTFVGPMKSGIFISKYKATAIGEKLPLIITRTNVASIGRAVKSTHKHRIFHYLKR